MSNHSSVVQQLKQRLSTHLPPDICAQLGIDGDLSPLLLQDITKHLQTRLTSLATYIPSILVGSQMADPQPHRIQGAYWNGTVLFADLSGFTALSEQLSTLGKQGAEEISGIITRLFDSLITELHRHNGILLKFGGDALTAFFDAEQLGDQHASLACCAALAMQAQMQSFVAVETPVGTFCLRLRIGVHSGRVFAAEVGDQDHIELVVTGQDIHRVALAQEIAVPGEVIISNTTRVLVPTAVVQERHAGFGALDHTLECHLPTPVDYWKWSRSSGDLADVLELIRRIEALQTYLPHGIPARFLDSIESDSVIGEFRRVTVLFSNFFPFSTVLDLVGDDVATATQVLNAYYRRAQHIVHHYGGIVNKVDMAIHGDKFMALFGAPVAYEDTPERAVRAAFELRAMLDEANAEIHSLLAGAKIQSDHPVVLNQRIGINTGMVFAGQIGGEGRREYSVLGRHVNLAARLMAVADAGSIVVSPTTQRATNHFVSLGSLDPVLLKGMSEPTPLAEAIAIDPLPANLRGMVRPSLIGRANELETLVAEGQTALRGNGRVVALVGDAGTGKTRLIEETLHHLVLRSGSRSEHTPAFFPYSIECQSYEQSTPYALFRDLLRQFFHIESLLDSNDQLSQSLQRRITNLVPRMAQFAPLINDILDIPIDETSLILSLSPEQRRDRAQELVTMILLAEAQQQPLMLIVDDLQWADASSLELLNRITQRAHYVALFIVLGYRIDAPLAEVWSHLDHCVRVPIRELPPESSMDLIRELLGSEPVPELVTLLEKAQGNPFFIEEVIREMIESGTLESHDDGWQLVETIDITTIPDSIEDVITARLDRLEERNRELLQTASVIGRRFPYLVLSGVAHHDNLIDRLSQLSQSDLILPDEMEERGEISFSLLAYLFKHALTRDVAYEAILYARRRDIHRRVGEQIEQLYGDRIDDQLAVLAHHYALAEEWDLAFDYHLRAARKAQERYANHEAITLLEPALQIAARVTDPRALDTIEVLERLGEVHSLIGEYDIALRRFNAALTLLRRQYEPPLDTIVRLHYHIARVYEKRADFDKAFEWVERAIAIGGDVINSELVRCLLLAAGLHQRQGRYADALDWGKQALDGAEQLLTPRYQAAAYKILGGTHRNLGNNQHALELISRALDLYSQVEDLDGLSDTYNDLANIYYELGRLTEARSHYESGFDTKRMIGDVYGQAMIANNLGDLFRLQDHISQAIDQYQQSLSIFAQLGSLYATGVLHMNLGATYLLSEDLATAQYHLRRSADLFHQAKAEDFLPELERYLAELHIQQDHLAEAQLACEISLTTAARLEARTEEGATRRTLSRILALTADLEGAWEQITTSLAILRESDSPHEIAKTLVYCATLAPLLDYQVDGQAALNEAFPILVNIGAQRDIAEMHNLVKCYGYVLPEIVQSKQSSPGLSDERAV
ncbi:MAG: adenylate/guanylate cyclase domain-containing protein [Chloroflexota bacterium]